MRQVVCSDGHRRRCAQVEGCRSPARPARPQGGRQRHVLDDDGDAVVLRQLRRLLPGRGSAGDGARLDRRAAGRHRRPLRRHGAAPVFADLAPTLIHELGIDPAAGLDRLRRVTDDARRAASRPTTLGALGRLVDAAGLRPAPSSATRRDRRRRRDPRLPRGRPGRAVRLPARAPTSTATTSPPRRSPPAPRRCSSTTAARPPSATCAQVVVDDTRRGDRPVSPPRCTTTRAATDDGRHHRHERQDDDDRPVAADPRARRAGRPASIGTLHGAHTTPEAPELQAPPRRRSSPPATGPS